MVGDAEGDVYPLLCLNVLCFWFWFLVFFWFFFFFKTPYNVISKFKNQQKIFGAYDIYYQNGLVRLPLAVNKVRIYTIIIVSKKTVIYFPYWL